MDPPSTSIGSPHDRRYVLGIADDAGMVASAEGVTILHRLPGAILVETDVVVARSLARHGRHVFVYRDEREAMLALSVFERD